MVVRSVIAACSILICGLAIRIRVIEVKGE
jgi:hypothetical protein